MRINKEQQATKERLAKFLVDTKMSQAEFVRTAILFGKQNKLRGGWAKESAGQSSISRFLNYKNATLIIRNRELIEATLDDLDKSRTVQVVKELNAQPTAPEYITEETLLNILENFRVQVEKEIKKVLKENMKNGVKDKYALALLDLVGTMPLDDDMIKRLDKLVGV